MSLLEEEQKYEELVIDIFSLVDYIHSLKFGEILEDINQQAQRSLSVNIAERFIEDLVVGITKNI